MGQWAAQPAGRYGGVPKTCKGRRKRLIPQHKNWPVFSFQEQVLLEGDGRRQHEQAPIAP
jgi:hypothetical protein